MMSLNPIRRPHAVVVRHRPMVAGARQQRQAPSSAPVQAGNADQTRCPAMNKRVAATGLVSRVSPVQTALRNCTRDEGRSFEVGNQVLISSHRKLLLSKAMVVNVAETSGQDSDRQG